MKLLVECLRVHVIGQKDSAPVRMYVKRRAMTLAGVRNSIEFTILGPTCTNCFVRNCSSQHKGCCTAPNTNPITAPGNVQQQRASAGVTLIVGLSFGRPHFVKYYEDGAKRNESKIEFTHMAY